MLKYLKDFLSGVIIGLTAIVPGISFGTLAMLFKIYEKAMDAFSYDGLKRNLSFTIPFIIGVVIGIFSFSFVIEYLLSSHGIPTYFAFMGLIAGCVPMIFRRADITKIKPLYVAVFAAALAFALFVAFTQDAEYENLTLYELGGHSPILALRLFITGIVCALAIIIPGLSGSILMLMLGTYLVILEAISNVNFLILAPFIVGVILGILGGSKIISILLDRYKQILYSAILGFVIGSIAIIYPGFVANVHGLIAILLAAGFAVVSYLSSKND